MYSAAHKNRWGEVTQEEDEKARKGEYSLYTLEAVVSKVESSTVHFEVKTISSFGVFMEPAVYELRSLEVAMKLLTYDI